MGWQDRHSVVACVYIILREKERVLLLRRFNTGYMDGQYSLPAGHLNGGETADVAACREAKEEAGVDIQPADLRLVHTMHRQAEGHERIDLFFVAENWSGKPNNTEPHKCDDLKWVNQNALPDNTVPEIRQALEDIEKDVNFSAFNFG